ncbi:MAG: HD domain-containing protein [Christensenella sp.]|nr:HD domain-containing protein [Christensenella sp.]
MNVTETKQRFNRIFDAYIKREGSSALYNWLESTDFFTAPASSRFHCAYAGGLCEHSLNVFNNLMLIYEMEKKANPEAVANISMESLAIVGLLHDVCKIDFYTIDYRNVKNKDGQWEKVPYYGINEKLPMGHGEKSVYLINKYIKLTDDEALAINWHMGGFDKRVIGGDNSISNAFEKSALSVLLQTADFLASYINEKR